MENCHMKNHLDLSLVNNILEILRKKNQLFKQVLKEN